MGTKETRKPTGNWFHDHLLSIVLATLFLLSWIAQLYFQYQDEVNEALAHGVDAPELWSGEFWSAFLASTFGN